MKVILILLAACAFSAAMVLKEKRAVNSEELSSEAPTTTEKPREVCASQTPCAWSIYQSNLKVVEHTIINSYCDCGLGTKCEVTDDDSTANALIHRCQIPKKKEAGDDDRES